MEKLGAMVRGRVALFQRNPACLLTMHTNVGINLEASDGATTSKWATPQLVRESPSMCNILPSRFVTNSTISPEIQRMNHPHITVRKSHQEVLFTETHWMSHLVCQLVHLPALFLI
jgi:hypothetical protein